MKDATANSRRRNVSLENLNFLPQKPKWMFASLLFGEQRSRLERCCMREWQWRGQTWAGKAATYASNAVLTCRCTAAKRFWGFWCFALIREPLTSQKITLVWFLWNLKKYIKKCAKIKEGSTRLHGKLRHVATFSLLLHPTAHKCCAHVAPLFAEA